MHSFAAQVGEGLADADDYFDFRRFVIATLDVAATVAVEGEEKVVYVRCVLVDESVSIASRTIRGMRHNQQHGFVMSARLIIDKVRNDKPKGRCTDERD